MREGNHAYLILYFWEAEKCLFFLSRTFRPYLWQLGGSKVAPKSCLKAYPSAAIWPNSKAYPTCISKYIKSYLILNELHLIHRALIEGHKRTAFVWHRILMYRNKKVREYYGGNIIINIASFQIWIAFDRLVIGINRLNFEEAIKKEEEASSQLGLVHNL